MIEEIDLFRILLPISDMFKVYCDVGEVVKNENDLTSYSFNRIALDNTLQLLKSIEIIAVDDGRYRKENRFNMTQFSKAVIEKILESYSDVVTDVFSRGVTFDTNSRNYYIYKNSISLKYAGLVMLFENCHVVESYGNRWLIVERSVVQSLIEENRRKINLLELEERLRREKELGLKAEEYVMNYERNKLSKYGLELEPVQISLIDVSAGFDVLSYDQDGNDKYIEVKSCGDDYRFFISANEVNFSKVYRERYWLYLFNRNKTRIKEIRNPYDLLFKCNQQEWAIEVDGYEIHKI